MRVLYAESLRQAAAVRLGLGLEARPGPRRLACRARRVPRLLHRRLRQKHPKKRWN